jgi:pSer/pThr/pTyr-binding forkhead associated (FHA) protein
MQTIALPRIHIQGAGSIKRTVELAGATTVGRAADNAIVIDETSVSRYHAMLLVEDGEALLLDLESSNGTLVNGRPALPDEPVRLVDGDVVTIGRVILRYEVPHDS